MNRKLTLKDLGAEHCNNLLYPVRCQCGCGNWGEIVIMDTEENNVFTLADALLEDIECEHAWIFIIEDCAVSGAYTFGDTIQYFTNVASEENVVDFEKQVEFAKAMIEDIDPCCIGVIQHTRDGRFRIVMEDIYDRNVIKGVKLKRKKKPKTYLN